MRKTILQVTCVFLFAAIALWGQGVSGTLSGKVISTSGAAIPNAAVTITNAGTKDSQRALTGPDGTFTVTGLSPGTYRIDVAAAGFKPATRQNVQLSASVSPATTIALEIGSSNKQAAIIGTAPAMQDESGEVATGLTSRYIRELPVVDRNSQQLIGLQTGVTPPSTAIGMVRDPQRNRFFAVNGQEPYNNQRNLDGVWNTEPFRGTAIRVQPVQIVEEKHIETSSPPVQRGYQAGAFVNNLTTPGTGNWHGSLFEFYSGNPLQSRNFFNVAGNPTPRFVYNQMGATVGGPIRSNHLFFFGSYQGTFQNGESTNLSTVPMASTLTGNFSAIPDLTLYQPLTGVNGMGRIPFPGNMIPASEINPTSAAVASYFPAPNAPGLIDNYVSNVPFQNHGLQGDTRVDYHLNDRTSAFVRYGFSNYSANQDSPFGSVIGSGTTNRLLADNAVAGVTHVFNPRLVTDFRSGYNRYDQNLRYWGDQSPLASAMGLSGFNNNLSGINIAGLPAIGAPAYAPENAVDNTFNWVWNWSWHTHRHNLTWGVDIRRIRSDGFTDSAFSSFGPNGTAYFGPGATLTSGMPLSAYGNVYNSVAGFLLGAPSQVGIANYLTTPTIRQSEYSGWVGDRIQLLGRLTLDLGLRYEAYSPIDPRNPGGAAYFDPSSNAFNYAGISPTPMQMYNWQDRNFAPRVGVAYRLDNQTVIRGGYGINYFQPPYQLFGLMAPITGSVTGVQGTYALAQLRAPFGPTVAGTNPVSLPLANGAPAGNLPATILPSRLDTPYVQTFSLQVQRQSYWDTMLSVGCVGSVDRNLPYYENLNAAAPGSGVAGLPFYGAFGRTTDTMLFGTGLTSSYNSLQASVSKRFSHGVSFLASYTWAKALGYTGSNLLLLSPSDLQSNYGPLDFDRQQVLTISHLIDLPFGHYDNKLLDKAVSGWQLNGIFTWSSGAPITVTGAPLSCACPGSTPLPSISGSPYLNAGTSILNPDAFFNPPLGQAGDLSRAALRAPGFKNYDLSLFKTFAYRDRFHFEVRGEAYNLTNTPRFLSPVTSLAAPDFGQEISTNGAFGRQVNLGLRILF